MASSTIVLKDEADANITYTQMALSETGALYKDVDRALNAPRQLRFTMKIGNPGALGNDTVGIKLTDAVVNSTTGKTAVGSVTVSVSIPRDDAWTEQMTQDLMIQLQDLFSDANSIKLADALVP